ncbi:hypothetical protein GCM10025876_13570 [Demequina litorisediminis]|uniref:Uncharacterized protein n=1 Tax=Demequina litorisediminis TaxID=1849022 RepID=A0ABQ6IBD0_9MICO|nr:hypothetical protein GCM10025876_13570 [Demequina litorisediminis]
MRTAYFCRLAQARRGLAGVEYPSAGARERVHPQAGVSGDARGARQEVQHGALGDEDRVAGPLDRGDGGARREVVTICGVELHLGVGKAQPLGHLAQRLLDDGSTRQNALGSHHDAARHGVPRSDGGLRGDVASRLVAEVLVKRLGHGTCQP